MPSSLDPAVSAAGHASLSAFLGGAVARGDVPGVLGLVVRRDRVLYEGAFGRRDVARGAPMTTDAIFRIASMTKPLTTAAILMLADDGRLEVDDPVSRYLPRFANPEVLEGVDEARGTMKTRPATTVMTIRHLLTHTSGVGYSWSDPGLAAAQRVTNAGNDGELPLVHEPGERWTYGAGTRVLGEIAEVVTGQTIDECLRTRVFDPLGMVDTGFDVREVDHSRVATVHRRVEGRLDEIANPPSFAVPPRGDGALYSTGADYARFVRLMLGRGEVSDRRLLPPDAVAAMGTNQIGALRVRQQPAVDRTRSCPFPDGADRDTWGFGFQITARESTSPGLRKPGSLGWGGLNNTHFFIDPATGIGAILLMQVLPFYDEAAMRVFHGFEAAVYSALS